MKQNFHDFFLSSLFLSSHPAFHCPPQIPGVWGSGLVSPSLIPSVGVPLIVLGTSECWRALASLSRAEATWSEQPQAGWGPAGGGMGVTDSAEQQCPWRLWLGSDHPLARPQRASFLLCCFPPRDGRLTTAWNSLFPCPLAVLTFRKYEPKRTAL